jgi:uncharacterized protein (DUF1330 family)
MTTYIVFTRESTTDIKELETYNAKAPLAMEGHAITPLAFYGELEVLEGKNFEGAVIISFPTKEEARAWYDSPLYREAREHRFKGADYRVFMVEGV